ncbi:MAG: phosphoribosylformylglycinamidine cyclo-ligase [Acidimicrobiia bacterium]|nr:phosphoribosylformylglycinamidine cyclo-ligase [Acidimicrobiia bacterium]
MSSDQPRDAYAAAGVDIAAGDEAVDRIGKHVRATFRPEVLSDLGGFGGLFAVPGGYDQPVLVASTDGVGTKIEIAQKLQVYDTVGLDVVAMCVDDLAVQGAEPLFFLDYVSSGKMVPERAEAIVAGVAEGCRQAGCALIGGEFSEHPGLMEPGEFDLVGFAVGVVERAAVLPQGVVAGDVVVGLASPGLRSNGYSLVRRLLLQEQGRSLDEPAWPGAEVTLGEELLRPSVIYSPVMAAIRKSVEVHAFAHITGGGIPGNLNRILPADLDAVVRRGTWERPEIFAVVQRAGDLSARDMERTFNLGVGMAVVLPAHAADAALSVAGEYGLGAYVIGDIVPGSGLVQMV